MKTKKITFEVPHRISGFFEIVDQVSSEPEKIGSRGAGFNLNAIGTTEIKCEELEENGASRCSIIINGKDVTQKAETTLFIFNSIKHLIKTPVDIEINHTFELPVGCGYGASGSGALGSIYGLNDMLDLNLSIREKGRLAHVAEVVNRTGLGTVCGQLAGGVCILKEPGYPCSHVNIEVPNDLIVICGSFGMIHTKSILTDPILNARIKEAGKKALIELIQTPCIETFMQTSVDFVKKTNILNILELDKTKELMDLLNNLDIIGASMNQLGRSVYAVCKKESERDVISIFESYLPDIQILNTTINKHGPRIIK